MPLPPWTLFRWGSRGLWYTTGVEGVYMAHIFLPDGIRCVIQASGSFSQDLLNVIHVQVPGGGPVGYGDVATVANLVASWWDVFYRHMCPSTVHGTQVVATSMASAPGPQVTVALNTNGDRTGVSVPEELTLCVKLASHMSGRRNRGRFYTFPAVLSDLASVDLYTTSYAQAVLGVLGQLGSHILGVGMVWAVFSPTTPGLVGITNLVAVDLIADVQRRRKPGQGR